MKKSAMISWSREETRWILRLWDEKYEEWGFSKSWPSKDLDENEMGWVHDSVLCEIAHLQDLGYTVKVEL